MSHASLHPADPQRFLDDNAVFDYRHADFKHYLDDRLGKQAAGNRERLIDIYYHVRDRIHYEIFNTALSSAGLAASGIVRAGKGFCLHKSIVFVSAARLLSIPARLKAAKVINHFASPGIIELMDGPVFLHWFAEVWLDGKWVKVTPVFNKLLCRLYKTVPLEFDGRTDSIHQPYDAATGKSMIFLEAPRTVEPTHAADLIDLVRTAHPRMAPERGYVCADPRHRARGAARPVPSPSLDC
jgi:transglutaminase-like putative cysteine protease